MTTKTKVDWKVETVNLYEEPCDCGSQVRHNNGGNYHSIARLVTASDGEGNAAVVVENTTKAQTLGSVLRHAFPDQSWKVITTWGYWMAWPATGLGLDIDRALPKLAVKDRRSLNKILTASREADRVYLAHAPSPPGELAAHFLKRHIVGQKPEQVVKRLRCTALSQDAIREAVEADRDIDEQLVERELSRMFLDRIVTQCLTEDFLLGRAMVPVLYYLVGRKTTGQRIIAKFRSGLSEVEFRSSLIEDPGPLLEALKGPIEFRREFDEDLSAPPPLAMSTLDLLISGTAELRFKSIEILNLARELYDQGAITYPFEAGHGISSTIKAKIGTRIEALAGKKLRGSYRCPDGMDPRECVRPTDISVDASSLPKTTRALYRLIWARTMAACSVPARVRHERITMEIEGVTFEASGLQVTKSGYDRVGLGMLLRSQEIPEDIMFTGARVESGWPREVEFLREIPWISSPTLVINALDNNDYIRFDGPCVVPTDYGRSMLDEVKKIAPELCSKAFLAETEYRLDQIAAGGFERTGTLREYARWAGYRRTRIL